MVVVVVCEPVRNTEVPVAHKAAAARAAAVVVACRPGAAQPPLPRTPHSGTAAAILRCPRGTPARSTYAALVAVACTPVRSTQGVEAAAAPVAAARSAPRARALPAAHSAAAARAPPPHSGAPAAETLRTDPAAARAAAG